MLRRIFFVLVLVLALALVACGGEQSETAEPAAADAGGSSDPPTATAEPTAEAIAEPTATPEPPPTPTSIPAPTEVVEESQPAEEEGAEQTASAGDGPGWGASGAGSQTACDHPYFPMRPGATWTYEGTGQTLTWEVLDVQGDSDSATAVLNITIGDVSIDYRWDCTAGEGMASFDFANLGAAPAGVELTIEQVSIDGQFLLPPEQLVSGATWTTNMESTISFTQEAEGTVFEATGDMVTEQLNTVLSVDPVAFDGQNTAGLQIEQVNNAKMLLSMMGSAMEQALVMTNNYNMGYGIGIVNQSTISDFGTETMDLVSYSIP
ncbi:MAG: hypothetical protein JSW55_18080 [Chloroflexota bacterium]|nr:MAG: hypothetical protein JSW55_18080 [Chloroflexota bacterium]